MKADTSGGPPHGPAKAGHYVLDCIRLRREIERVEPERRYEERIPSPLAARDAFGHADQIDVSRREHQDDALIEAEVADGILDLAVFDVPDAVARQPRHRRRAWIDRPNVEEARHEQRALRGLDHGVDARSGRRRLEDERERTARLFVLLLGPVARVPQGLDHAVANEIRDRKSTRLNSSH